MAQAHASTIIHAPVETVWATVRDFGALAAWHPGVAHSEIEGGMPPDAVGCIRALRLGDGTVVRERLLLLDDSRYAFAYNFETPAFPVANYVAHFELIPVTSGDVTFARWTATFDEAPDDAGKYVDIVSHAVFAAGLQALAERLHGVTHAAPPGARWQGLRPAKVFCSSVLRAPLAAVWREMRDFAGMGGWHTGVADMHMLHGARADQVSGVRRFSIEGAALEEQLTCLSDVDHALRYMITRSGNPWMNYHAGVRLHAVSASNGCFAVWTADWVAAAHDDVQLIPMVHNEVFQRAFDTLDAQLAG